MPNNTTASVQQPESALTIKTVMEIGGLILLMAALFAIFTKYVKDALKDVKDHQAEKWVDLEKDLNSYRDTRKQAEKDMNKRIDDVSKDTAENTRRIVQLESNYIHIKEGIDDIKISIREIRNAGKKDH